MMLRLPLFTHNDAAPFNVRNATLKMKKLISTIWHLWVVFYRFWFVVWSKVYVIMPYFVSQYIFLLPLRFIYRPLWDWFEGINYRTCLFTVGSWASSCGHTVVESGDDVTAITNDRAMVICNHLHSGDVPTIMLTFSQKKNVLNRMGWIQASVFKYVSFGWVSWAHGDYFINTGSKEQEMSRLKKYLSDYFIPRGRKWVVFFPEGGFLYRWKEKSQMFAKKSGLKPTELVLLPRIGAFRAVRSVLTPENTKYLINMTIAYEDIKAPPSLGDFILNRRKPQKINLHYEIIPIEEVPDESDEAAQEKWLQDIYYRKEELLKYFYEHGHFDNAAKKRGDVEPRFPQLDHQTLHIPTRLVVFSHAMSIVYALFILYVYYWFCRFIKILLYA